MRDESEAIEIFLRQRPFAVVGASMDRRKYGNKCLRTYLQNDLPVYAVNPREQDIEGVRTFASLAAIPERPGAVSIITPPAVTEQIVEECGALGIRYLWMQPGAESDRALTRASSLGLNVIAGGPCLLVVLRFRDR